MLLLLSGCAFMDMSTQDTAVPIHPDLLCAAVYATQAIDLADTYYMEGPEELDPDVVDVDVMSGYKLGLGIFPRVDLIFNVADYSKKSTDQGYNGEQAYMNYKSEHFELGIKYLVGRDKNIYFSVLPSVYVVNSSAIGRKKDGTMVDFDYFTRGIETQALLTYKPSQYFSLTTVARANFNSIDKDINGTVYKALRSNSFGFRANMRLSYKFIHITPETGIETITIVHGKIIDKVIHSLGVGFQF